MAKSNSFIYSMCIFALIVITSCGGASKQKVEEISTNLKTNKMQCEQNKTNGIYKTNAEVAMCINEQVVKANQELNYPYMDLIQLLNAYRLAVAEKLDNGEITETQAELIMAEILQRINTEEYNRNMQRAAIMVNTWNNFNNSLVTYKSSIIRTPITCYQSGNVITCQ